MEERRGLDEKMMSRLPHRLKMWQPVLSVLEKINEDILVLRSRKITCLTRIWMRGLAVYAKI